MQPESWDEICLPSTAEHEAWELFHENSKTSRLDPFGSEESIVAKMRELYESLPFEGRPELRLPEPPLAPSRPLGELIRQRTTTRAMEPCPVTLEQLGSLLFHTYGVTRDNADNDFPRPFRVAPSGGGLYPLEVFFHTAHVEGLRPGLYHYQPDRHSVRHLRDRDETLELSKLLVQPDLAHAASILFLFTAVFERSVFKYGERGYRFVLLEAGHVAQNLILTANALGLGSTPIGGYFDRAVDEYLELDGLRHSTVYMNAVGRDRART